MYRLYGFKGSGSAAIEMALNAIDAPYEVISVASWEASTPVKKLTSLNPLLQIPTLVLPDETVLTESAAILIHLAYTYPGSGILSEEPVQCAKTIQGLVYLTANCYPAVGIVDYPERWTTGKDTGEHENIRAGTRRRLYYLWEIFSDMFTPHLSDTHPGILEFLTVNICRMTGAKKQMKRSRPEFYALLNKLESHPLLSDIVARHWDW